MIFLGYSLPEQIFSFTQSPVNIFTAAHNVRKEVTYFKNSFSNLTDKTWQSLLVLQNTSHSVMFNLRINKVDKKKLYLLI